MRHVRYSYDSALQTELTQRMLCELEFAWALPGLPNPSSTGHPQFEKLPPWGPAVRGHPWPGEGKSFYACVPYTQVHFPTLPNPKFAGKTGYGDFPDAVAEMDSHVGDILDAVDVLGIRDNTIVVFTSDNGPEATWPWQESSGPWRGYYFAHMEGSLPVPFIIRWPGRIPTSRVSNEIVHEVDTITTLARIAGAAIPTDRPIDGVDQTDFMLGKSEASNRKGFPVFVADRLEAVKWRNWKMVFCDEQRDWWTGRSSGHEDRGGRSGKASRNIRPSHRARPIRTRRQRHEQRNIWEASDVGCCAGFGQVSDAGIDDLTTRSGGRHPKSAKARSRGVLHQPAPHQHHGGLASLLLHSSATFSAARSWRILRIILSTASRRSAHWSQGLS